MGAELALGILLAGGCTSGDDSGATAGRQSLVDQAQWEPVSAQDDPSDHRPAEVDCPSSGWSVEADPDPVLEVDTGVCSYLALSQPSLVDVARGDSLVVRIGHDDLEAEPAAVGHSEVWLGDQVLWDQQVDIPSPADEGQVVVTAAADTPAGTLVNLHLHNHGANTWTIVEISAGPSAP